MDIIGSTSLARVKTDDATARFIIGGFLARYPANTRKLYEYHLRDWWRWCEAHDVDPMQAKRGHIEAWARWHHEERGLKLSSVGAKITPICGFYKYAALDGFIADNPAKHVRRPRIEFVSTTNGMDKDEAGEMLRRAAMRGPTANAMLHLLILNGLRIGECLATNIEHLGKQGEFHTIHLPYRKGGKVGTLGIADSTYAAIRKAIGDRTEGPILLGKNGLRLQPAAARRIMVRLRKKAGIDRRITPHSCRHTMVTLALDAGVPVRDIMDSSGHSNPIMIGYYDRNRGVISRNATYTLAKLFDDAA